MDRGLALAAAIACSLLAVSGASGTATQHTPKRGGTVVVAVDAAQEWACLNVLVEDCQGGRAELSGALGQVLPGAFAIKPDGSFEPSLVTRVDIVSRRPFTLVYRIRPEARWSDGASVTASDFVFSHRAGVWAGDVKRMRALDSKTLRVVLATRDVYWHYYFEHVLPRHALAGLDLKSIWQERIDDPRTGKPIGSGPFLVSGWKRGQQITFVRNPRYWRPNRPFLDRLVFRFVGADAFVDAAHEGTVDVIQGGTAVEANAALELRRSPAMGVTVVSTPGLSWEHLDIRIGGQGSPALQNRLIRRALAYGIDRVAIARAVARLFGGSGDNIEPLDSLVSLVGDRGYRPNWSSYRYRPETARALLEQAGCRRGADRTYACNGARLSLRLLTTAGVDRRQVVVDLVQSQVRRVGVEVVPTYEPSPAFFPAVFGGQYEMALFAWGPGSEPAFIYACGSDGNATGYCDRLLTRDLNQLARLVDDARRRALLNGIDMRLAKVVPSIPLFQSPYLVAVRRGVMGVIPNPAGATTWNAEDWWLAD